MLIAGGQLALRAGKYALKLAVAPDVFLAVVHREGFVFHSRFFPPALDAAETASIICLVEGRWASDVEDATLAAPVCFAFPEDTAPLGAAARRAEGAPYRAIELHVPLSSLRTPLGAEVLVLPQSAALWATAERLFLAATDEELSDGALGLLDELTRLGVLQADVAERARRIDERFIKMWDAFRPLVEAMYLSPTVKELSDRVGMSPRDFDREMRAFFDTVPAVGASWRSLTRRWRVKLALLLLGAEGASVEEIAQAVGYGSSTAMGRAFRDVGMMAPSEIREEIARASLTART